MRDGRLAREEICVPRMRCSCGHVFDVPVPSAPSVAAEVSERVVREGVVGAAKSLGASPNTVRGMLRDHVGRLDRTTSGDVPDVLGVRARWMGGAVRILVTDDDEETVLDVLDDLSELDAWSRARHRVPRLVLVDVDAGVLSAVRRVFADSDVAVPPGVAASAVIAAAERAFVCVDEGRNHRPEPALCRTDDADLTDEERDEISTFWSPRLRAFRRAVLFVLEGLRSRSRSAFDAAHAKAMEIVDRISPASSLAMLLDVWREPFRCGVGEAWSDPAMGRVLAEFGRRIEGVRIPSGIEVVRMVVVFGSR